MARGRGGFEGAAGVIAKLRKLAPNNPEVVAGAYLVVGEAAADVRDEMRRAADAAGWGSQTITMRGISGRKFGKQAIPGKMVRGSDLLASIFSFAQPGNAGRYGISGLAGISKSRNLVTWIAGPNPKSPRAKVAPGGEVAMGAATMLEFGTTTISARPAIRPAIETAKPKAEKAMKEGLWALIVELTR